MKWLLIATSLIVKFLRYASCVLIRVVANVVNCMPKSPPSSQNNPNGDLNSDHSGLNNNLHSDLNNNLSSPSQSQDVNKLYVNQSHHVNDINNGEAMQGDNLQLDLGIDGYLEQTHLEQTHLEQNQSMQSHSTSSQLKNMQSEPIMPNRIDIPQLPTVEVSERVFMNTLLKHTLIALAIIIPLAVYTTYAQAQDQAQEVVQQSPEQQAEHNSKMVSEPSSSVHSVAGVDLAKYAGTWYEIARFPMYFQRNCASDVTATYTLNLKQGVTHTAQNAELADIESVTVLNACKKQDGSMMQAEGLAVPANATGSELKVTFLPTWLRWLPVGRADYWVLDLDAQYQHALVGTPDRDYLWILSRTPTMSRTTYDVLVDTARQQGFDVSQLQVTEHANQVKTIVNE